MGKTKSNKKFMLLSAIGIILVVDAHCGAPLNLFNNIFPYNSFFMPMFMFISGYFFVESAIDNLPKYLWKKTKNLLLPFLLWNLFYVGLVSILYNANVITYGGGATFKSLFITPFTTCSFAQFNNPSWFVGTLFVVVVIYAILRKIFRKFWRDIPFFLMSVVLGAVAVYLSRHGYYSNGVNIFLLRTIFFIQFYELGIIYRKYLEHPLSKLSPIVKISIAVVINLILISTRNSLNFGIGGFGSDIVVLPLITSCTGILFWLTICELIENSLGNSKYLNFISSNTFGIMMHHILFFNVINLVVIGLRSIIPFEIDPLLARSGAWNRYEFLPYISNYVYLLIGINLPLFFIFIYSKTKELIKKKIKDRKESRQINTDESHEIINI